jgi:CBS domain containing-hemolysin-like protein
MRLARPLDPSSIREEFVDALSSDESGRAFSPEERAMLRNILHLRDVRVEDIMIPRAEIEAVEDTASVGDLMRRFEASGKSRMPVYGDSLDEPIGMIHIRDLIAYITRQASLSGDSGSTGLHLGSVDLNISIRDAGVVRKVLFVPPSMLATDLMARMKSTRTQMALVIDEYGGTDGLVSLEDIVEIVVGDIEDEHDTAEQKVTRLSDDAFIIDAKAELVDIAAIVGSDFDISEQAEDVDTIGGLVFSELGRIPARGEVVQAVPGFEFHVLDSDPRRIKRLKLVRKRVSDRAGPRQSAPLSPTHLGDRPNGAQAAASPLELAAGQPRRLQ